MNTVRKHSDPCNSPPTSPTPLPPSPDRYTLYSIGLQNIRSSSDYHPIILICYNENTHSTIWTRHFVRREKEDLWSCQGCFKECSQLGANFNSAYKNSGYHRGHLAPAGDFGLNIYKQATYYYLNVII